MTPFLLSKIEVILEIVWNLIVRVFKFISPIKIFPKEIISKDFDTGWSEIKTIQVVNRLNKDLYDVYIGAITKETRENFDIKVVSDNIPNAKTVEHMKLNTNVLIVFAEDKNTKNQL